MALQSLDIKQPLRDHHARRPGARQTIEVAKLIDVSTCIGCKACQVACMEWNDLRDEVGIEPRRLRQPDGPDGEVVDGDALLRGGSRTASWSG